MSEKRALPSTSASDQADSAPPFKKSFNEASTLNKPITIENAASLLEMEHEETKGNEAYIKNYMLMEEFLHNTHLNLVKTKTPAGPLTLKFENLEQYFTEAKLTSARVIEMLDAHSTASTAKRNRNNLLRDYDQMIYTFFYQMLCITYANVVSSSELVIVELFLSLLLVHQASAPTALENLFKLIENKCTERLMNVAEMRHKLFRITNNLLRKRIQQQDGQQDDTNIVETDAEKELYANEMSFFGSHFTFYKLLILPFMQLQRIFNEIDCIDQLGFTNFIPTTLKKDEHQTVSALKFNLTRPLLVCMTSRLIIKGGFTVIELTDYVSECIISKIRQAIRFQDAEKNIVELECYSSVKVCNLTKVKVVQINHSLSEDVFLMQERDWDVKMLENHQQIYILIDSVNLVYCDDNNKIAVKVFPKTMHALKPGAIFSMIDFEGLETFENERSK